MFEVGKRYNRKDIEGVYTFAEQHSSDHEAGWFKSSLGKWCFLMYSCFDPTPIDDTPAPRMVTTCDIGARVVRVKINPDMSSDWECPIGKTVTVKSLGPCKTFEAIETGLSYYLSDFVLADEQPKKEATPEEQFTRQFGRALQEAIDEKIDKALQENMCKCGAASIDDGTDKTPPDPAPGIASVMFGSKPRLMYGSLMQIQGPTKDEELRNARTEEERKRYAEFVKGIK